MNELMSLFDETASILQKKTAFKILGRILKENSELEDIGTQTEIDQSSFDKLGIAELL
jgi:hypothetical protein